MEALLVSKRDAAQALSISLRSVERLIYENKIPTVRVLGSVRIPVAALRSIAVGEKHAEQRTEEAVAV
jgi:excisionase family DNA binding protein